MKYTEPKYKIFVYKNGCLEHTIVDNQKIPFDELETVIDKMVDNTYEEISSRTSGKEGYNIYFNETNHSSFCISYKIQEWTGLYDSKNNPIYVGDKVKNIFNDTIYEVLYHSGFLNMKSDYYIRQYTNNYNKYCEDYELNVNDAEMLIKI